jgi:hypothetical protein
MELRIGKPPILRIALGAAGPTGQKSTDTAKD